MMQGLHPKNVNLMVGIGGKRQVEKEAERVQRSAENEAERVQRPVARKSPDRRIVSSV
jgi:hypothetical protein